MGCFVLIAALVVLVFLLWAFGIADVFISWG